MNSLCGWAGRWAGLAGLALGLASQGWAEDALPVATNLWTFKLGHIGSNSSPALAPDGTIYQATFDGLLLAFSPAGTVRWQFSTGTEGEIKSSPAVADDGTIYFGGWDKTFYALDPAGTLKWSYPVGAIVISSPAIATDGTIYFGAFDNYLYALTSSGKLKWRFSAGGEISTSPAIGPDGSVYFVAMDGNLYALTAAGTERWHCHCGSYTEASPVLDELGNVYVPSPVAEMEVNQQGQGRNVGGVSCPVEGAAVAVTGRIYWSRPWRTLQAFRADATVLWQADTEANLTSSPVVGADGMIYFTAEWYVYAVQPVGAGLPPAKSSWPMFRGNAQHTGRVATNLQGPTAKFQ